MTSSSMNREAQNNELKQPDNLPVGVTSGCKIIIRRSGSLNMDKVGDLLKDVGSEDVASSYGKRALEGHAKKMPEGHSMSSRPCQTPKLALSPRSCSLPCMKSNRTTSMNAFPKKRSRSLEKLEKARSSSSCLFKVQRSGASVVRQLISDMGQPMDSADLYERACRSLGEWSHEDAYYRSVIASCGGIVAILQAMNMHSGHAGVQCQGCFALSNLNWEYKPNLDVMNRARGTDVIRAAMSNHTSNENVQNNGALVLRKISDCSSKRDRKNCAEVEIAHSTDFDPGNFLNEHVKLMNYL